MRRITTIMLMILSTFFLCAQEYPGTATGDDFLSLRVNPAALAFGNAGGIAMIQPWFLDDSDGTGPEILKDFSFQAAAGGLGYYFDKADADFTHNLTIAGRPFPNFYLGLRGSWENSDLGDSSSTLGALIRPTDAISLGATMENIFSADLRGRLGVGFRPLLIKGANPALLTLGADLPWDSGFNLPILHAATEPVPGFAFNLAYDLENELFSAGLSYSVGIGRAGTLIDDDGRGAAFVHLGSRAYSTPALPLTDPYIRFAPGAVIVEEAGAGFTLFAPRNPTLFEVIDEIERLKNDPAVKGLLIENQNILLSRAGYLELIEALNSFRESGKKVIYYYENISLWNYVLAAATGDAIYLNRLGSIDLRGIGTTRLYFAGLLDQYGVTFHNIRSHPYKSSGDTLSRQEMSASEREMLTTLYDGIYAEMIDIIETGRGEKLNGATRELIARGPYLISGEAADAGLVDGILFQDEIEEKLKEFDNNPVISDGYFIEPYRRDWSDPYHNQIALIYAVGNIIPGRGAPGISIGADSITRSIREARQNPFVKAVLLRIDSGGGSSLASDIIAREIKLTVDEGKPVIVSMGGTAASGGYYIAAYADKIVASPVSITGSIGVFALFPELGGLLEKYQVGHNQVATEENAAFSDPFHRLSDEEQERLQATVDHIYELFVEVVAEGREMEQSKVDAAAQGRVWTGRQALERGLVDQLGGLKQGLAVAVEEAEIKGEYILVDYSQRDVPLSLRMAETFTTAIKAGLPAPINKLIEEAALISLAEKENYLYLMPWDLEE